MIPALRHCQAIASLAVLLAGSTGCNTLNRSVTAPEAAGSLAHSESPYLKAHMKNGDLYVLHDWAVDEPGGVVRGQGQRYDANRNATQAPGRVSLSISDVALFETNKIESHSPTVTAMTIMAVTSAVVSVACLANPKTCFGSCPTFYIDDGKKDYLAAEGFSDAVAPAFERTDLDALFRAHPHSRDIKLRVTNEALETHVIRKAQLLAVPRPPGGRVVATQGGEFWQVGALHPPVGCRATEGDCLNAVRVVDDLERGSLADERDLATHETVDLTFDASVLGDAPAGLVIEARQTFITTFLFYQALAYMGRQTGSYMARVERGDAAMKAKASRLHQLLGPIELQSPDGRGGWRTVGQFDETGPIAREVQFVPLPAGVRADHLRLLLTRGHWRLGHVALAAIAGTGRVGPVRLSPTALRTMSGDGAAAQDWLAGRRPALVTGPGDAHELAYQLPGDPEGFELFLESQGYYIEWMREPWLKEESLAKTAMLFETPSFALRQLAPAFKKVEPDIENMFWKSRYVVPHVQ